MAESRRARIGGSTGYHDGKAITMEDYMQLTIESHGRCLEPALHGSFGTRFAARHAALPIGQLGTECTCNSRAGSASASRDAVGMEVV
ncbi:hypothetical protein IAQ61_009327 [Plenodomus lingam]|uniref:uncharacterized protein n=1 Tax=Leptosphaeria maculans TaxID=5022 RepID=UPI00332FF6B6|nr:hypothetical protein IAQ61_009327 [Plenodomus lingam]